ncbi:MAG TPA: FHA domain-containing protein, partial [Nannocystaceae bacterium]|nr:FHA domain-containing protein [Nannocystaceae bacterium]
PALRIPGRTRGRSTVMESNAEVLDTPQLDQFMRRAMAKNPAHRFGSGREMAAAFKTAAQADGVWHEPATIEPLFEPLARPFIDVTQPGAGTRHYDMREGPVVIGRHEACQYVLSSPRMSRLHACFYQHRGRIWIADLQSQNGTQYQGRGLTVGVPVPLRADGEPGPVRLYDQELEVRTLTE